MPCPDYQRSKKKGKLISGLLFHRPISAHHKGLSITRAISSIKSHKKHKVNKKEKIQVEVVNSTFKMQRKIQSVLIRAEDKDKIDTDMIKGKHELEVNTRNHQKGTFSQAHASITTNQFPATTLQTVLGSQPILVLGDKNPEIRHQDFIRSESPLNGFKSQVKVEFELLDSPNMDLSTVEKQTSKKELVLCRKLIKGHDYHNPLSSGQITSKTDSVDI